MVTTYRNRRILLLGEDVQSSQLYQHLHTGEFKLLRDLEEETKHAEMVILCCEHTTDGDLDTIRAFKSKEEAPVVLVVSWITRAEDLNHIMEAGADAWLPMGLPTEAVIHRMEALFKIRSLRDQLVHKNRYLVRLVQREQIFSEILRMLADERNYTAILQKTLPLILDQLVPAFRAQGGLLFLEPDAADIRKEPTCLVLGDVYQEKILMEAFDDLSKERIFEGEYRYAWRESQNAAFLLAKIALPNKLLGYLFFYWNHLPRQGEDIPLLVTRICRQIAMALDSALTYHSAAHLADEQKKATRTLLKQNEKLLALDATKSDFLSMVSHELRTPLASIKGFADNLFEGIDGELNTLQSKSLSRIQVQTDRLTHLINDILTLVKLDSGKTGINKKAFSLRDLLAESVKSFEQYAADRRTQLTLEVEEYLPPSVGDPDRIMQVLGHLVTNALRFTPEEGAVHVRCCKVEQDGKLMLEVSVADNGIGIPQDQHKRIFDRFYQIEHTATRKVNGAGLGLAFCDEILKRHNSSIKVESDGRTGSTFSFFLSAHVDGGEDALTVLIVDDEPYIRDLIREVLSEIDSFQCEALTAGHGGEALDVLAKRGNVDIIFTDLMMPEMDGPHFLKILQEVYPEIPVIAITANIEDYDVGALVNQGIKDYLKKPFNLDELKLILQRHAGNQRLQ